MHISPPGGYGRSDCPLALKNRVWRRVGTQHWAQVPLPSAPCQIVNKLAASLLSRWIFSLLAKPRQDRDPSREHEVTVRGETFTKPEDVAAYARRLEATCLPFAVEAAHAINLVPPTAISKYVVLDNACGSGAFVEWLVQEFERIDVPYSITATDYSALMMNEVQNRRERLGWSGSVRTVIMDAQNLKFSNETFTHILMTFAIMLIPDYMSALRSMYRVLQRGGVVAVTSWKCQGHWEYLVRAVRQIFQDKSYPAPRFFQEKWTSGRRVAKLLSKAGFRDVKTYERKRLWEWTSKEEFIAFVTKNESPTLKTYSSGWTSQEKMDITAKIKEILDTEFPETETFKVPMIANIVVGHKR